MNLIYPSLLNSQDIRLVVLTGQDKSCAQALFSESHPIIKNWHDSKQYSHTVNGSDNGWYKPSKVTSPQLLQESIRLLKQYKFEIDTHNFIIETHAYEVNNLDVDSPFGLHQDDFGVISEKVVTIIWYLRKDDTINGGDLHYSYTDCSIEKTNLLNITDNMTVMFTGNLWHMPQKCSGAGARQLVVIQFKDLARQPPQQGCVIS